MSTSVVPDTKAEQIAAAIANNMSTSVSPDTKLEQILADIANGGGSAASLQVGSQAITNGQNTVTVTFSTTFASTPVVVATVSRISGDPDVYCDVNQDSISTTGFIATLSASVPNGNYKLTWMASI